MCVHAGGRQHEALSGHVCVHACVRVCNEVCEMRVVCVLKEVCNVCV